MYFIDLTLPTPGQNLALDEALLTIAERDDLECLRLWESPSYCVVLGKNCRMRDDVIVGACAQRRVPIARRVSGGGTVLLGPGCLNLAIVLRYDRAPRLKGVGESIAYVLDRHLAALHRFAPDAECRGISDIAMDGLKISGNSQRRQRSHFLHHGTILYDFDVSAVSSFLSEPERQPDYRRLRRHANFLRNVPATRREISESLAGAWQAVDQTLGVPFELVDRLVCDKYGKREWVERS